LQRARNHLGTSGVVYENPQFCDIFCAIHISITNPTTSHIQALKFLALTIAQYIATMTSFRGVARVNQSHRYAKLHAFVGQELAQLEERPTSNLCRLQRLQR